MKCFIIALDGEAQPVLDKMQIASEKRIHGKRVILGELSGESAGVVICGVGKVNAACGTQYAIDAMNADAVINIGTAGGLNGDMKIGGIYAVECVVQYDFDIAQINGTAIGTLDECDENYLPLSSSSRYPLKKLGTGDRFNDSKDDYNLLTRVLAADMRDMEGGAIAQVCMHAGVKCREYKVISDLAESGSTTEQYIKNLELCYGNLSEEIENIFRDAN